MHTRGARQEAIKASVICLSPLAVPRLLSTFLPQDLCIPLSSLLSSLGAHPLSEHFTSLGPYDPSHPRCVPLLWKETRCPSQMFVYKQPNPEHRAEKHHSSGGQTIQVLELEGNNRVNGTRLAPSPRERTELFLSSWLSSSKRSLIGLNQHFQIPQNSRGLLSKEIVSTIIIPSLIKHRSGWA